MAAGAAAAGACSRRPCHEPWKLSKRVITGNQARRQREAISSGCAAAAFAFAFAALQPLVVAWLEVVSVVAVAVAPHAQANNQMERIKFEKGIKATKWLAIFQNTSTCVRCPISLTQRILERSREGACRLGIIGIVFFLSAAAVNFCGNSINFKSQCQLAQWDKERDKLIKRDQCRAF